jgi:hypothetical protein
MRIWQYCSAKHVVPASELAATGQAPAAPEAQQGDDYEY